MNCPSCQSVLLGSDVRCARCGMQVGARGTGGVPGWVWAVVAGAVLLCVVPCGCLGVFLALDSRTTEFDGTSSSTSSSTTTTMSNDAPPEVLALAAAIRAWSDDHAGRAPQSLEELRDHREVDPAILQGFELRDAFGNEYDYRLAQRDDGWRVELWTFGADGLEGGDADDADESVLVIEHTRH